MSQSKHQPNLTTKLGFILGWLCFALAFMAAAAESALGSGFITSTNDLLVTLIPGKWIAFKARHASDFFNLIISPLFYLPGWFVAGLPAGFLLWTCRPHREEVDPELYNSLMTFDRLAEMAEEEGALNDDPSYLNLDINDYDDDHRQEDVRSAKDYMEDWQPEEIETEPDHPLSPEEKMQKARDNLSIPFDKLS